MADDDTNSTKPSPGQVLGKAILAGAAGGATSASLAGADPSIGAALGAISGGVQGLTELAVEHVRSGDRRLRDVQDVLAARALAAEEERLRKKLGELEAAVGRDEVMAAVLPAVDDWKASWTQAEGKKRRAIMAALVSAFDAESYEVAMTQRFFGRSDRFGGRAANTRGRGEGLLAGVAA